MQWAGEVAFDTGEGGGGGGGSRSHREQVFKLCMCAKLRVAEILNWVGEGLRNREWIMLFIHGGHSLFRVLNEGLSHSLILHSGLTRMSEILEKMNY